MERHMKMSVGRGYIRGIQKSGISDSSTARVGGNRSRQMGSSEAMQNLSEVKTRSFNFM